MSDSRNLNRWQITAICFAVLLVIGGMAGGFWSSFNNLYAAAAAHGWTIPALLPLDIDSGILAYVLLDQLAVTLGARSRWLHYVAWLLAAFTVWANAAVAPSDGSTWRVIYAAMPALWVLGVEALRFFWRLWRNGTGTRSDRIPVGRWLANPFTAVALQRRMWMLSERSWARMSLIEDARLYARDLIRATCTPARYVPGLLMSRVRSGRLPEAVLARIDTAVQYPGSSAGIERVVQDWVASLMVLPELVSADLKQARQNLAPSPSETPAPDEPTNPDPAQSPARSRTRAQNRPPDYTRKPSKAAAKKMSGANLAPYVKTILGTDPLPSQTRIMDEFHIGRDKASEALAILKAGLPDAEVIQLAHR